LAGDCSIYSGVCGWHLGYSINFSNFFNIISCDRHDHCNYADIQAIRSTPLLIQIYVIYFSLPALPIIDRRLDELEGGIIALGLNAGAYMSEIIRAGIESVSKGQVEAAQSVGMTYMQRMRYVVLPQAFAKVIPPLIGQTAVLIKDSSLVSFIGVFELFGAGLVVLSERLMPNEAFMTVAFCYLVIYAIMLQVANYAQKKLGGVG